MFKGYDVGFNVSTPNISISEGLRPAQHYAVASYLPTVRYDQVYLDYKVISLGKVLAIDSGNFIVPAGLIKDIERAIALDGDAWTAPNQAGYSNLYSATDVALGIKNWAGVTVTAGEPVIMSFFDGANGTTLGTQENFICGPIGIAPYDIWKQNGAGYGTGYSAGNPADYQYTNYNLQQGLSVWTHGFIELPVVANVSGLILPGLVVFEGTPSLTNGLVTFNGRSNFVSVPDLAFDAAVDGDPTDAEVLAFGKTIASLQKDALGRILFVDDQWPKSFLEYVRVWEPSSTLGTPVTPGSATKGLPDNLWLSGQSDPATAKAIRINFLIH